jgi:hypothetical protein
MSDKVFFIDKYFEQWEKNIQKATELLENCHYFLEGILVLSCYLGAFASLRFPALRDGEAYVKIVIEYSHKKEFFEKIDLLFFYQWPKSNLRDHGAYKALKNHSNIVEALNKVYGTEDDIKSGTRYISQDKFMENVVSALIPGFDENNLRDKLPLFSLAELLYRYVRCDAVHNYEFPLFNEVRSVDGNAYYKDNHAITGKVLIETTRCVLKTLWEECKFKEKWPFEI